MQKEETSGVVVTRNRPKLPEEYNVPMGEEGLLEWDWSSTIRPGTMYFLPTLRPVIKWTSSL